jgi:hypothetical protein
MTRSPKIKLRYSGRVAVLLLLLKSHGGETGQEDGIIALK